MKKEKEKNGKYFGRGYGFLLALLAVLVMVSIVIYLKFGQAAACGCLLWGTVGVFALSMIATSILSIVEEDVARTCRAAVEERK